MSVSALCPSYAGPDSTPVFTLLLNADPGRPGTSSLALFSLEQHEEKHQLTGERTQKM